MPTATLTTDTRVKLINLGLIPQNPEGGFFQIGHFPFKTVFPELGFPKNRIPEYYENKFYIEYLGFTPLQSFMLFNNYRVRNPAGLVNSFTLLIEAKKHVQRCSYAELASRRRVSEMGDPLRSSGEFIWCEKFGLTKDIIQDIDALLKRTKENNKEMDRYLNSCKDGKKVEDLLVIDFLIEIIDRRFTKLFTLERDARAYLEGLQ